MKTTAIPFTYSNDRRPCSAKAKLLRFLTPAASLSLLLLATLASVAQAPYGQYLYTITTELLWDFGGTYTLVNAAEDDAVSLQLVHHANGQITGVRTEVFSDPETDTYFQGTAYENGRIVSKNQSVGFLTSYSETINGTDNGVSFTGKKTAHGTWALAPGLLALQEQVTGRICIGHDCESETAAYQVSLLDNMDGVWTLDLDVEPNGNQLSGSAVITLSNRRTLDWTITGRYNPNSQVSILHLKGYGETTGTSLTVTIAGPQVLLQKITGSVLGQKIQYP